MTLNKQVSIEEAIAQIPDGASVMVGGFGVPGTPFKLVQELVRQGQKNLTVIKNDANEQGMGIDHLLANGQVRKLIVTHIGLNPRASKLLNEGQLEVEFCAQGILAERIHAGGAGLSAIVTDIGVGTELNKGKQEIELNGKSLVIEPALRADFSLIHCDTADSFGNLVYTASARNFNPLMAMAGDNVIVEAEQLLPLGALNPDHIHTVGAFVGAVGVLEFLNEKWKTCL